MADGSNTTVGGVNQTTATPPPPVDAESQNSVPLPPPLPPDDASIYETSYRANPDRFSVDTTLAPFYALTAPTHQGFKGYPVNMQLGIHPENFPIPPNEQVVLALYVGGDRHNTSLAGQWSLWKGSMAKGAVPEADRPNTQDIFGHSLGPLLDKQVARFRESASYPVLYFEGGDITDKGCSVEESLYEAAVGLKPDLITLGNHRIHQGIVNSLRGPVGWVLKNLMGIKDYRKEVWAPACNGEPLTKWWLVSNTARFVYGIDAEQAAKTIQHSGGKYFQNKDHKKIKWEDAQSVVDNLWHRGKEGIDVCILRLNRSGHDPNEDVIFIAFKKQTVTLPDGSLQNRYFLSVDDTDYIHGSAPIPGVAPAISELQSKAVRAYVEAVIGHDPIGQLDTSLTHFPLSYGYDPVMGSRRFSENYFDMFNPNDRREIPEQNLSAHTHDYRETLVPSYLSGFGRDMVDHTTTSVLDGYGGMLILETVDPRHPSEIHYHRINIGIDPSVLTITPRVAAMVDRQSQDLLSYRRAFEQLPDDIRIGLAELYSSDEQERNYGAWIRKAWAYKQQEGPFLDNIPLLIDQALSMALQYATMLSNLDAVVNLLNPSDPIRQELAIHSAHLRRHYSRWGEEFEQFRQDYAAYLSSHRGQSPEGAEKKMMVDQLNHLLDLFNERCPDDLAGEACVTKVEFLLRTIELLFLDENKTEYAEAVSTMAILTLRAGQAEQSIPIQLAMEEEPPPP